MQSRFETVLVIGHGKTAGDVLRVVAERQEAYGYSAVFIEHETHALLKFQSICRETGAAYKQITDSKLLTETLLAVKGPALVISAGNYYLFPNAVVEKPNLEIINFHSALLPKFPGRNAQSWAIWEEEKIAGATWHYVTASVDGGAIIAQRETSITEDMRAYELTRAIMEKASELFREFYEELLVRHIEGRSQPEQEGERKIYYSWELPGGGICSENDPPERIYRMLRAMDYGKSDIFPPARLRLEDGTEAEVLRYRKVPTGQPQGNRRYLTDKEARQLILPIDKKSEIAIRLRK